MLLGAFAYPRYGAMQDDQQDHGLTIAEAAAHLGVSSDTVRRRIRRGELRAVQVHTPNGPAWRVLPGVLPNVAPPLDGAPGSAAMRVEAPLLAKLLAETQAELVRTAAAAAMWQARAEHLSDQVEQMQRALPAPTTAEISPGAMPTNGTVKTTGEPAEQKRPWWRFW